MRKKAHHPPEPPPRKPSEIGGSRDICLQDDVLELKVARITLNVCKLDVLNYIQF